MMMTINSTLDTETADDDRARVRRRSQDPHFEEELIEVESRTSKPEDLVTRAPGRDRHGPRRSRQDDAARRDPRRRAWPSAKPAASRSTSARITCTVERRAQRRVPRHAGPRGVHADARPRREGHRRRRARRRGRRRRDAADAGSDRPRQGGQRADHRGDQQDRQAGRQPRKRQARAGGPRAGARRLGRHDRHGATSRRRRSRTSTCCSR